MHELALMESVVAVIDEVRGRGRCRRCGGEVSLETPADPCACGGVDVARGRELRLEKVEVQGACAS